MYKKTQFIELLRNIKKTMVSFISVVLFVFLGMAIFLGINWANTGFIDTIENTLNQGRMEDVEIIYPYGLSEDLLNDIKKLDDVESAEGIYSTEAFFCLNGIKYQANVTMLTDSVNIPAQIIGRRPVLDTEIAVEKSWAQSHGISIGDTIELEEDEKPITALVNDSFVVTALIISPQYINQYKGTFGTSQTTGISNDLVLFVTEEAFNKSAFAGYTGITVRSYTLRKYNSFSDEYKSESRKFIRRLKLITDDYVYYKNAEFPEGYKAYECSILDRASNPGIGSAGIPNEIMSKVKYTLSCLFIIVGVFVCYSAVSRIVYEHAKLIGTKKALGLNRRQITISYILYAVMAAVTGSAVGAVAARYVIEPVILAELSANYNVTESAYCFSMMEAAAFFLFEVVSTAAFAYLACRNVLKKRTIQLLKDERETAARQRWFEKYGIWKKLSLFTKTAINNLLNDKKRVFATITGIVGCCALLACALTLVTDVVYTRDYHLNKIAKYDSMAYIDMTVDGAMDDVDESLRKRGIKCARVYSSSAFIKIENGYNGAEFLVFDDDRFYDLFSIETDKKKQNIEKGVWVCKSYGDYNHLAYGDGIEIIDSDGIDRTLSVGGIFDYYLPNDMIIMSAKSYENVFEKEFRPNALIFRRNAADIKDLTQSLDGINGFISIYDNRSEISTLFDAILSIIFIVSGTFIFLSVVLAFAVILNLQVMFVSEKKTELIVMMINGYSKNEVKKYIYFDTIALTIIGSVIGTAIGVLIGFATLKFFASECITLILHLNIPVCIACMMATGILTAVSVLIALRKIDEFSLKDINEI